MPDPNGKAGETFAERLKRLESSHVQLDDGSRGPHEEHDEFQAEMEAHWKETATGQRRFQDGLYP